MLKTFKIFKNYNISKFQDSSLIFIFLFIVHHQANPNIDGLFIDLRQLTYDISHI